MTSPQNVLESLVSAVTDKQDRRLTRSVHGTAKIKARLHAAGPSSIWSGKRDSNSRPSRWQRGCSAVAIGCSRSRNLSDFQPFALAQGLRKVARTLLFLCPWNVRGGNSVPNPANNRVKLTQRYAETHPVSRKVWRRMSSTPSYRALRSAIIPAASVAGCIVTAARNMPSVWLPRSARRRLVSASSTFAPQSA